MPRLCVEVVIKDPKGIVLSKREIPPALGKWHIPGGTVFFGESLEEAAVRVAERELGLKIQVRKVLGVIEYPLFEDGTHSVGVALLCAADSGKLRGSSEAKEVGFFNFIPENTIAEQAVFLKRHRLVRV